MTVARRNSLFPRPIQPELIMVGDEIEAEYPSDGGITVTKRGTVARIDAHAGARHLVTEQGAVLAVWSLGFSSSIKFSLIMRDYQHESLSLFDDPDRIAS